jgi:hypothetical protein
MKPFMNELASFLRTPEGLCNLNSYTTAKNTEVLSLYVASVNNIKFIVDYFNRYPLIGDKLNDFKK